MEDCGPLTSFAKPGDFQRLDPGKHGTLSGRSPPSCTPVGKSNQSVWQSDCSPVPTDLNSCHLEAVETPRMEIIPDGIRCPQSRCAPGAGWPNTSCDQQAPAKPSHGLSQPVLQTPACKQEKSHSIFLPVFNKTKESLARTNKPIAVSSPKWYKTNSIKKSNYNRFVLLNICKHRLHRNYHIKVIVIMSVIITTTGKINFLLSLN